MTVDLSAHNVSVPHFNGYGVTGKGEDVAPGDYLYLVHPAIQNRNL